MTAAVIIPAYNAAAFLGEAIESALGQTAPASRIIVVDDGSTDGSAAVAEKFGSRVTVLRQPNAGVSAARNAGARLANAQWLLFLDADDRLIPEAMERLHLRANEENLGVVYGQTRHFDEASGRQHLHGKPVAEGAPPAGARASFWKSAVATPGAAMIRRTLFEELGGFDSRFNTAADRDLWIKAGALAAFGFVSTPVVEKRTYDGNMSGDRNRARIQAVEVQLGFLEWSAARGTDTAFLQTTPREIIERNLARAVQERAFAAAALICAEAVRLGIESRAIAHARRLGAAPGPIQRFGLFAREKFARCFPHG